MREIKFRVYLKNFEGYNESHFNRKDIGRMFDVEAIDFVSKYVTFRCPSTVEFRFDQVELMQYTGLKDKNGKEIYEGDIVKEDPSQFKFGYLYGPVIFNLNTFKGPCYTAVCLNENETKGYTKYDLFHGNGQQSQLEIVGNVYENPELLEDK